MAEKEAKYGEAIMVKRRIGIAEGDKGGET
jgi:hypothetical protein